MGKWMQQVMSVGAESSLTLIEQAFWSNKLRPMAVRQVEKYIFSRSQGLNNPNRPARVKQDREDMMRAMLKSAARALDRQQVSREMLHNGLRALVGANVRDLYDDNLKQIYGAFAARHEGKNPPWSMVISPSKACNLRCVGCYASAEQSTPEHLEWDLFSRILSDAKKEWGMRFFTVSGGEPFAYRSQGKGLMDAAIEHQDCFFMVYTNGTLITQEIADRIGKMGNLTPVISIEGMEEATDWRRGKGTFKAIVDAMGHLRRAGVPFGVSLTATRLNCEEILSDQFVDFLFNEQQAVYGWIFQYMPIGRGYTLDLLPTPEQRVWMWRRVWEIIRDRGIMLADLWNCGTVSEGCIAAGVYGGYFYIDWNGKVMPCVFVPYAAADVREIYRSGQALDSVIDLPYFRGIRQWQAEYGLGQDRPERHGNWLLPCSFRDHYGMARDLINHCGAQPEDEAAAQALEDDAFRQGMIAYDEALHKAFDPIWQEEYLEGKPLPAERPFGTDAFVPLESVTGIGNSAVGDD